MRINFPEQLRLFKVTANIKPWAGNVKYSEDVRLTFSGKSRVGECENRPFMKPFQIQHNTKKKQSFQGKRVIQVQTQSLRDISAYFSSSPPSVRLWTLYIEQSLDLLFHLLCQTPNIYSTLILSYSTYINSCRFAQVRRPWAVWLTQHGGDMVYKGVWMVRRHPDNPTQALLLQQ